MLRYFSFLSLHTLHQRRRTRTAVSVIISIIHPLQRRNNKYEYHYYSTSKRLAFERTRELEAAVTTRKIQTPTRTTTTPVIIVGGGPVGLFLSILLSDYQVPHLLLERQSVNSRFRHPQAHFINTRSMELFRTVPTTTTTAVTSNRTNDQEGPSPSSLYGRVQRAMAPVRHWQSFRYGTAIHDPNPLAEIIHPVDRPLQSKTDANGILRQSPAATIENRTTTTTTTTTSTTSSTDSKDANTNNNFDLSPCTVGHLAQHTLGRILYETAIEKCHAPHTQQHSLSPDTTTTTTSQILYDTSVEQIEWIDDATSPMLRVVTQNTNTTNAPVHHKEYYTDLVIAADGAHSTVRQQLWKKKNHLYQGANGDDDDALEQHLINVHVTIPMNIAHEIHTKNDNYAMLYSVYTPEIIAMIVCHTIGEYVIQIPYFPPYQTIEYDFTHEKVLSYLETIFGYPNIQEQCQIHSIASWTMTSWIVQQYYQLPSTLSSSSQMFRKAAGVALVGDAAHVFPPAGGFGMNTGLQDAHNIAWKIAAVYHQGKSSSSSSNMNKTNSPSSNQRWTIPQILKSYEQERRPVAQQNAALSIRNYERLLEVTKTLYLNAQHPALLCTLLDHSPLPLSVRQDIFRTLLKTALYPLSWLRSTTTPTTNSDNSGSDFTNTDTDWLSYANHLRSNIRQILDTGAGLPLLFPRFEIGFTYHTTGSKTSTTTAKKSNDTVPEVPHLRVGRLVPHVGVFVTSGNEGRFPNLKLMQQFHETVSASSGRLSFPQISITDLPTQMRNVVDSDPTFVLLYISTQSTSIPTGDSVSQCTHIARAIQHRIGGLPVKFAILQNRDENEPQIEISPQKRNAMAEAPYLMLIESTLDQPTAFSFFSTNAPSKQHPYYILIRPDGHISGMATIPVQETKQHPIPTTKKIVDELLEKVF